MCLFKVTLAVALFHGIAFDIFYLLIKNPKVALSCLKFVCMRRRVVNSLYYTQSHYRQINTAQVDT